MAQLQLTNLNKIFPDGTTAVNELNLAVEAGEFLVLVGPSGCGKSTTLRMIAGLETPTSGKILLDNLDLTTVPPANRNIGMVFQNFALYPHKTVYNNLAFGLKIRKIPKNEIDSKINQIAAKLEFSTLLNRYPAQLSGGQKQRVALARALLREGKIILFDEPLSNLDAALRQQLRLEIATLQRQQKFTAIFVTHDQTEAMTLGHRIAVMNNGKILQIGSPTEIYQQPANTFVASFIGSPGMNLFPVKNNFFDLNLSPEIATVGIRPEKITPDNSREINFTAEIIHSEPRGNDWLLHGQINQFHFTCLSNNALLSNSSQSFSFSTQHLHLFNSSGNKITS